MKFRNREHKEKFCEVMSRMKRDDVYHRSAAYLIALADLPPEDVFDFDKSWIKHSALFAGYQTGSSRKATRLLYNLWNGTHEDHAADDPEFTSRYYAVDDIMDNYEYFPWFVEAIKIRYGWDDDD